jgi:uncharacterized protein
MNTEINQVNCPTCKKKVAWTEKNSFRPFCSKKCQLIDFGDWASERNALPVDEPFEDFNFDGVDE